MGEKTQKINQQKIERVAEIKKIIENARDVIFTDFRGMTVAQITELRNKLKEEEASYKIIKNNYTLIAFKDLGLPATEELLTGPTALALILKDSGPVAKILITLAKEMPLAIKGGIIEGRLLKAEEITALSKLPGKKELYAKLMGSLKSPATNMVYALKAVASKLVRTLQAVASNKKE